MDYSHFLSKERGTEADSSGNRLAAYDHLLTTRHRGPPRRAVSGPHNTWLAKRRDGASDYWMIAWYDPGARTVRYKSTRKRKMADAKLVLAEFQLPENAVSLPPAPPTKHSFVYFVGDGEGPIKIGLARHVHKRLAALQANSPVALRILALAVGTRRDELYYHRRFAAHRLHFEWFSPHPDILSEITRLNDPQQHRAGVR